MAAPATQAGTKPAAKPAATHTMAKASHATGTVEKFDAATKTLTVKHDGKDLQFVIGDTASLMRGKDKIDTAALGTATGQLAKIEYTTMGGTKTADKVELSAAAAAAAKPAAKKKNG
jgi:Cu/Ag efflux protein CusF